MRSSPLEISAADLASCGALCWRQGDVSHLTVVVKGTFTLAPGKAMTLGPPAPVHADDVHAGGDPRRSVVSARDRVPRRPKADVLVTGPIYSSAEASVAGITVGVTVLDGDRELVGKRIRVVGDNTGGLAARPFTAMPLVYERAYGGPGWDENPIGTGVIDGSPAPNLVDLADPRRTVCFGPMPFSWPARARLAGSFDPAALANAIVELPADLDWACFHAAPVDQRCAFLRGGEWVVLENVYNAFPALRTRLPDARAVGRLYGVEEAAVALEFVADGLHVETERAQCHVTWRATIPLARDVDLARLRATAGIETEGRPVVLPDAPSRRHALATTMELGATASQPAHDRAPESVQAKADEESPSGPPARRSGRTDFDRTVTVTTTAGAPSLPFRAPSPSSERQISAPPSEPLPTTPRRPRNDPFSGTIDIPTGYVPPARLPFPPGPPPPAQPPVAPSPPVVAPPPVPPQVAILGAAPLFPAPPPIAPPPALDVLVAVAAPKTFAPAPSASGFTVPAHLSSASRAAAPPTPASPAPAPSPAPAAKPPPAPAADEAPAEDVDAPERYSTPESRAQARTLGALMVAEDEELERFLKRNVAPASGLGRPSLVHMRSILRALARALTEPGDPDAASRLGDAWNLLHQQPSILRERRRRATGAKGTKE